MTEFGQCAVAWLGRVSRPFAMGIESSGRSRMSRLCAGLLQLAGPPFWQEDR